MNAKSTGHSGKSFPAYRYHHTGRRVFANNIEGKLTEGWSWPLNQVLSILKLGMSGICVVQISDQGALQIIIDSGIGAYNYILPALAR